MTTFYACAPGVMPTYPKAALTTKIKEWYRMHQWCTDQGWVIGVDYAMPAEIPRGKFYFSKKEYQILFILRWV